MKTGKRVAFMKGAPEVVLARFASVLGEDGTQPLREDERGKILSVNEEMAGGALRVLGFAYRELPETLACVEDAVEHDLT